MDPPYGIIGEKALKTDSREHFESTHCKRLPFAADVHWIKSGTGDLNYDTGPPVQRPNHPTPSMEKNASLSVFLRVNISYYNPEAITSTITLDHPHWSPKPRSPSRNHQLLKTRARVQVPRKCQRRRVSDHDLGGRVHDRTNEMTPANFPLLISQ